MGGLTMSRLMTLITVSTVVLCAACGGDDASLQLGVGRPHAGLWCPPDPATFVGPLQQECLP